MILKANSSTGRHAQVDHSWQDLVPFTEDVFQHACPTEAGGICSWAFIDSLALYLREINDYSGGSPSGLFMNRALVSSIFSNNGSE